MTVFILVFIVGLCMYYAGALDKEKEGLAVRRKHVHARVRELSVDTLGRAFLEETLKIWDTDKHSMEFVEKVINNAHQREDGEGL